MKTTVTIQDGKISIQVDDEQPAIVSSVKSSTSQQIEAVDGADVDKVGDLKAEKISRACKRCGANINRRHKLAQFCTQVECVKARAVQSQIPTSTPPDAKRACKICGVDISSTRKSNVVCSKPECKKEYKRQYMAQYHKKASSKQEKSSEVQEEKQVDWCKYCQAYTTHSSLGHPKVDIEPQFLPGHEKTAEEIESWRPKISVPADRDKSAYGAGSTTSSTNFTDPWDCDACRRRSHLCPLHQTMTGDGATPQRKKGKR